MLPSQDEDGLCWVTICDFVNGDGQPEHFSIRFDHAQQWAAQEVACRYEFSAPTLYPEG